MAKRLRNGIRMFLLMLILTSAFSGLVCCTWEHQGSSASEETGRLSVKGEPLNRDDYASEEDYIDAAIAASGKEADVPFEIVEIQKGYHYVRGKVWVVFSEGCSEAEARKVVADAGGVWVSGTFAWGRANSVETYFDEADDLDAITVICENLMKQDEVDAAYPEYVGTDGDLHLAANDTYITLQDYLVNAAFCDAWDEVTCGGSVSIAVLDSGIKLSHDDLWENVSGGYDAFGSTSLDLSSSEDTCGHGTKVAGIACARAGNETGIAGCSYNASLTPVRVTSSGSSVDVASVIRALEYLRDVDTPDVVNMSFAMPCVELELPMAWNIRSQLQGLVDDLYEDRDVVVVASVGNDAGSAEHYPAKFNNVVGVGSVSADLAHASYSNTNSTVDICAFGTQAYTTTNRDYEELGLNYKYVDGTSFAAPQVAAAAALMRANNPDMSAFDIELGLFQTAAHPADFVDSVGIGGGIGQDGKDDQGRYGFGVLDVAAAVGWTPTGGGSGTSPHTADDGGGGGGDAMAAYEAQLAAQEAMRDPDDREAADALERAMAANPDVFGWLSVDGTNVSLPLCRRAGDDAYYLTHGSAGEEAPFGAAYIEGANSPSLGDPLTVAYGHTCRGAAPVAFTELHYLGCRPFFDALGPVRVRLPGKVLEYRVAAASVVSDEHILGEVAAGGPAALQRCYDALCDPSSGCSLVRGGARPSARRDRVLMLSTCSGYGYEGRRFVVTCVLAGEREV